MMLWRSKDAAVSVLALTWLWICSSISVVKGQESGVEVTATIDIVYDDATRRIAFVQTGFVNVPQDVSVTRRSAGSPIVPQFRYSTTSSVFWGTTQGFADDQYLIPVGRTNSDTRCLSNDNSNVSHQLTSPGITRLAVNANFMSNAVLFLPADYESGSDLSGSALSLSEFNSLADAGFQEGTSCLFQYDVDNNVATGSASGYDAAIVWNIVAAPSSTPSSMPSASSEPSNIPSISSEPSNTPSNAPSSMPSCVIDRKTKAPRGKKGKSEKDNLSSTTKSGKTQSPLLTCPQTKSPKSTKS